MTPADDLRVNDPPAAADVALVFGSNDPAEAERRAVHAAGLVTAGWVPRLVFSGGDVAGRGRSEAAIMAAAAVLTGVSKTTLLLEEQSRTTAENVLFSRRLLIADPPRTLILVSAWWHLRRCRALTAAGFGPGVRLLCCPAPGPDPTPVQVELERALLARLEA